MRLPYVLRGSRFKNRLLVRELKKKIPGSFSYKKRLVSDVEAREHITSKRRLLLSLEDSFFFVSVKHAFWSWWRTLPHHTGERRKELGYKVEDLEKRLNVLKSTFWEVKLADISMPRAFSLVGKKR